MKNPTSKPMSFWTEQDVFQYIKKNNLPLASVYGVVVYAEQPEQMRIEDYGLTECGLDKLKTTGCERTGCIFCAFGCHRDSGESRFQRLEKTHPRQYEYCINGGEYVYEAFKRDENGEWQEFDMAWEYLNKSIELGSISGYNTLGLCYLRGTNPENKVDLEKAKYYFEIASNLGYIYSFNNLGKMCEDEGNIEEAIKYYKISADMGESWALNKIGEYYRKNGDLSTAYIYYSKSIEAPISERVAYPYFNLAKYYFENGYEPLNIKPNKELASKYYKMFEDGRKKE
jgi:tetratricopeptide (TPR) repeat protein